MMMMIERKMGWDTRIIDRQILIATRKRKGWVRSINLDSCGGAQWFQLLSNTIAAFFNARGTWHLSQHGELWFAVRFAVL